MIRNLLYTFGDNITTLLPRKGIEQSLPRCEALLVAVISNEIQHLPYDSFLFRWVRALGCNTTCTSPDEVVRFKSWPYLRIGDPFEGQLCPDVLIELADSVLFFEFKRMAITPSANSITAEQLGKQHFALSRLASGRQYRQIIVVNTAPQVYVTKQGLRDPATVILEWLQDNGVSKDNRSVRECVLCLTIEELQSIISGVIETCKADAPTQGIIDLYQRAQATIAELIEGQKRLVSSLT